MLRGRGSKSRVALSVDAKAWLSSQRQEKGKPRRAGIVVKCKAPKVKAGSKAERVKLGADRGRARDGGDTPRFQGADCAGESTIHAASGE